MGHWGLLTMASGASLSFSSFISSAQVSDLLPEDQSRPGVGGDSS